MLMLGERSSLLVGQAGSHGISLFREDSSLSSKATTGYFVGACSLASTFWYLVSNGSS